MVTVGVVHCMASHVRGDRNNTCNVTAAYIQSSSGNGNEITLCSVSLTGDWDNQKTTTSSTMISYTDVDHASKTYIWAQDATTAAYAVLDDVTKIKLGSYAIHNGNASGGKYVLISSDIASRVRGVYISVTGTGGDGPSGYKGSATIYGYRSIWK